ncbi:hypothetical protein MNB_SV-6-1683 [hydrothermal vent metagenome]|uniref:Uncharacterized protein n=1 Tax=hydrothermal vent metagenome TaxID=652676 RepID=A0A1W1BSC2_9ZZZZ
MALSFVAGGFDLANDLPSYGTFGLRPKPNSKYILAYSL